MVDGRVAGVLDGDGGVLVGADGHRGIRIRCGDHNRVRDHHLGAIAHLGDAFRTPAINPGVDRIGEVLTLDEGGSDVDLDRGTGVDLRDMPGNPGDGVS